MLKGRKITVKMLVKKRQTETQIDFNLDFSRWIGNKLTSFLVLPSKIRKYHI